MEAARKKAEMAEKKKTGMHAPPIHPDSPVGHVPVRFRSP